MRARTATLRLWLPALLTAALISIAVSPSGAAEDKNGKPSISIKANPAMGFAPMRVVMTADLKGGSDDYAEFYCAAVEWEWGDGTKSESSTDCAPYESGKSEIKRRFTVEPVFRMGAYRVMFHLKRHDKSVGMATVSIQVRPGLRDGIQ